MLEKRAQVGEGTELIHHLICSCEEEEKEESFMAKMDTTRVVHHHQ